MPPGEDSMVTRSHRARRANGALDDADRRLIELLSGDGRRSNRALAAEVGLTEATVAGRVRALFDRRVLGVTATLDWQAAGYHWDAWLEVTTGGGPLKAVGEELAALDGVHAVYVVFGPVDLLVHVLLPEAADAVRFISERITAVRGVRSVRPNVTLETRKYTTRFARLPVRPAPLTFPAPVVEVDELDRRLIRELVVDGRQSNRRVARKLGVSEGTVRVRLRRLEGAGLLRIAGQSDPYLAGAVAAWAFIGVDVASGTLPAVSARLREMGEVTIVAVVAGRHDLLMAVATRSRSRLVDLVVEDVRSIPGVESTETWEVVQTLRLDYQWARLLAEDAATAPVSPASVRAPRPSPTP